MKVLTLAACVTAVALVIPAVGSADDDVNLSGTWKMDTARSESAHSGVQSGPVTLVIKQTPTELSIETRRGDQSETIVYLMDGSETKKPASDNGPFQWRLQREGPKLVTETHRNINRATVTIKEALSLSPKGKELNVDRTLTVQHGYTMRGAQNYSSAKDVFVKAE